MHVYVCVQVMCTHVLVESSSKPCGLFPRSHQSCFLGQGVALEPGAGKLRIHAIQKATGIHHMLLPGAGITEVLCHAFLLGFWGLDSCPHACVANTLPIEQSPEFLVVHFRTHAQGLSHLRVPGVFLCIELGVSVVGQKFNFRNYPHCIACNLFLLMELKLTFGGHEEQAQKWGDGSVSKVSDVQT